MWGEFIAALILLPVVVLLTFLTYRFHKRWVNDNVDFWGYPTVVCGILGFCAGFGLVISMGCYIYKLIKAF